MPYRIQRIEDIVKQLESGDLKLRVRVLEVPITYILQGKSFHFVMISQSIFLIHTFQSERAAQKARVLQMGTIYTVVGGILLNLGLTLRVQGSRAAANGSFIVAGKSLLCILPSIKRDEYELNRYLLDCVAGFFFILFVRSMQKVKKLDKFEKMIWWSMFLILSSFHSSPTFLYCTILYSMWYTPVKSYFLFAAHNKKMSLFRKSNMHFLHFIVMKIYDGTKL